ncbi:ankyrin repeat domain-containing protein 26-like [Manacus candei]|uniref:ankyrin repeat domain-containing protein 26-like n=1 Tax=Manacus candei TaxID=415023 RepID=UPI002226F287|nr:ankyrin repeat domain-containing protein 26-like [Manacus candei]
MAWVDLHSAAARGDLDQLRRHWWLKKFLVNRRNADKLTPLHLACINGHADVVRFLAGKNCKLNRRDKYKRSPLMLAVQHQHRDCVAILLEHGANHDHRAATGNTALHFAVLMSSKSLVELLLEHGADIAPDPCWPSLLTPPRWDQQRFSGLDRRGLRSAATTRLSPFRSTHPLSTPPPPPRQGLVRVCRASPVSAEPRLRLPNAERWSGSPCTARPHAATALVTEEVPHQWTLKAPVRTPSTPDETQNMQTRIPVGRTYKMAGGRQWTQTPKMAGGREVRCVKGEMASRKRGPGNARMEGGKGNHGRDQRGKKGGGPL